MIRFRRGLETRGPSSRRTTEIDRLVSAGTILVVLIHPMLGFYYTLFFEDGWGMPELERRPPVWFPLTLMATAIATWLVWTALGRWIDHRVPRADPAFRRDVERGARSARVAGAAFLPLVPWTAASASPRLFDDLGPPLSLLLVAGFVALVASGVPWLRRLKDPAFKAEWDRLTELS